jgi:aspartyl-tRNA(Asn)/glutamyl-tRNA(Gln) amidotransferase subunit A
VRCQNVFGFFMCSHMYVFSTIKQYHTHLLAGSVTCLQVTQQYLNSINANKHLNAFVATYTQQALAQAQQLDALRATGAPLSPLHGVVIALKDVICYKDQTVTAASKILKGFVSQYSATAVERLVTQGAIIIGTCNCDEFAMGSTNENSVYGPTLNAADVTRVPGGSSGGSAVAVQANMCMVSLGSDTGGSVRQPADFCGVVGLKPSYGRVSRYGLIAYASSFDQIGVFGNNVQDVATILESIEGPDAFDSTATPTKQLNKNGSYLQTTSRGPFTFGYFKQALYHPNLDAEIKENLLQLIAQLKADGHKVTEFNFELIDNIVPTYYVLTTAEASSNLGRFDGVRYGHRSAQPAANLTEFYKNNRSEGFSKEVQRRIMLGTFVLSAGYYDAYFTKAQQVRQLLINQTTEFFKNCDALILPVSPTTAFKQGEKTTDPIAMYLADIYTVYANLVGIPGIALPLFKHSNGMPFGMQLHTTNNNETQLLQIAQHIFTTYKK